MLSDDKWLKSRITSLNSPSNTEGQCVVYVMSRDQRIRYNHSLLAAQKHALAKHLPLAVVFCVYTKAGRRAREQYEFMIAGLEQLEKSLAKLDIPLIILVGEPYERLQAAFFHLKPDAVYFDFNPLRGPMTLQAKLAENSHIPMYRVDTHNIVPALIASDKKEVGAYTLRTKIHRLLASYLVEPDLIMKHPQSWPGPVQSLYDIKPIINDLLAAIPSNGTLNERQAGESAANKCVSEFIAMKLARYAADRNNPSLDMQSDLSPYLHFGHISALEVALLLRKRALELGGDLHLLSSPTMPKPNEVEPNELDGINALIEEMVVRKELSDNYCLYEEHYDNLLAGPAWAVASLDRHRSDEREFLYSYDELRDAQTHDPAWNAAQLQMVKTGKMHGYMRMYWAKKVLEWTTSPEETVNYLIKLNDFFSIDGGDPNGYAGILWSVAGVHDRPWSERAIFGVVRYMNYAGLKRKFDITEYESKWIV